ncbi:MAG: hypothetical protein ACK5UM_12295 [Pseudomonadota bacterium]|jgi:hypothetical protein|nr:hypothetical protein [Rubrivivax sp.]MCA3257121.1 hypothetical protein [Rubrivivax sp.]MCE2913127.1 hypothetical protein [Rubrivivax sp.]MCZ8030134.1 hypothetical protein [Rubrivivax sp.]
MSTLRTLALAALLAAGSTLAHADKDCSSVTADGDDLVAPPVKATKAVAKTEQPQPARAAQRQATSIQAGTPVTAQVTQRTSATKAEPRKP